MDLLGYLLGGDMHAGNTPGPTDDFWYQPIGAGSATASGMRVDSDTAQMVSAWYRGRDILATVLAMLPLSVYRRLPDDGGSEPATDLGLYDVLHNNPNDWQDSFQWRREKMFHIIDHGWGYDWIVPGARGIVGALHPIKPWFVTPKQIKVGPNRGRYIFHVRDESTGQTTAHTQDEIFFLRGAEGKGILEYARTSIGTALATETYAAGIFGRGTMSGGHIEIPGQLDPEAGRRMALSFLTKPGEWHIPKVMEQGSKFIPSTMTPEDAQMLLSRKFSIDDMARWLGVPRQMLENSDPSFGNAEQFDESFLTYSMGGWLSLFEFGINGQLVVDPATVFAQFRRQAFVRGKFSERMAGLVLAAGGPIMTRNEARKVEDYNTLPNPEYDQLLNQQNITGKPSASEPNPPPPAAPKPPAPPEDVPSRKKRGVRSEQTAMLMKREAARLVAKEVKEIKAAMIQHGGQPEKWPEAVKGFYDKHASSLMDGLLITGGAAYDYCTQQRREVLADGAAVLERWIKEEHIAKLAAIALEDAA